MPRPARRAIEAGAFPAHLGAQRQACKPGASGPIWKSLLITADLDGCATNGGVRAEIRLYQHGEAHRVALRRPQAAGSRARGGLCRVPVPGAGQQDASTKPRAAASARRGPDPRLVVRLADAAELRRHREADGQIVVGSEQAPLVQLGDFNLGKWQPVTRVEKPHVYSWVMNNYWFTNFRTEQEGEFRWHYYLTSTGDTSNSQAISSVKGTLASVRAINFSSAACLSLGNSTKLENWMEIVVFRTMALGIPSWLTIAVRKTSCRRTISARLFSKAKRFKDLTMRRDPRCCRRDYPHRTVPGTKDAVG